MGLIAEEHLAHGESDQWRRKDHTHPEATVHVLQFGILFLNTNSARLQRHATDRTAPWARSHNLGMHGAGVLSPAGGGGYRLGLECHPPLWTPALFAGTHLRIHGTNVSRPAIRALLCRRAQLHDSSAHWR